MLSSRTRRLALTGPHKQIASYSAAAALLLSFACGLYYLMNSRSHQMFGELVAHVQTRELMTALTFDDGPTRESVESLLPVLAAYHAHATFFVEGGALERDIGLGRELVAAGHELANHSSEAESCMHFESSCST